MTPRPDELVGLAESRGATITRVAGDELEIAGMTSAQIGDLAAEHRLSLHELTPLRASLEDAYLALTRDEVEYRSEMTTEGATR